MACSRIFIHIKKTNVHFMNTKLLQCASLILRCLVDGLPVVEALGYIVMRPVAREEQA